MNILRPAPHHRRARKMNMFKRLLQSADRPVIGTFAKLPTLEIAEIGLYDLV
ncbi:hypothetical protein GCM10023191_056420 [Actinoallomurus oryzae]|uniref:Uncharacterized protein n=1 Tax=Actinoallomurus oryzae TaxID=502180 RepID=A0ABP8QIB5_9ACTN